MNLSAQCADTYLPDISASGASPTPPSDHTLARRCASQRLNLLSQRRAHCYAFVGARTLPGERYLVRDFISAMPPSALAPGRGFHFVICFDGDRFDLHEPKQKDGTGI